MYVKKDFKIYNVLKCQIYYWAFIITGFFKYEFILLSGFNFFYTDVSNTENQKLRNRNKKISPKKYPVIFMKKFSQTKLILKGI